MPFPLPGRLFPAVALPPKNTQNGEIVLDALEGGEDGLTIGRHSSIVGGLGLFGQRLSSASIKRFVGTPRQVVDQMEAWFTGQACDGFVIAATHMPGAYEDVVRLVVPELQRRKLFHTTYAGQMLRENLGLPCPQPGREERA